MKRACSQSWNEIYHGVMPVETDGWLLTLFNDCVTLDYCEYCRAPDGRVGTLELWKRDGADPVDRLSAWERVQLERLSSPYSVGLMRCADSPYDSPCEVLHRTGSTNL